MWSKSTVFYQIYTLGFCGAPPENDGETQNRIARVTGWIPHLQSLSVGAVLFNPVFQSDTHGYDSRDLAVIDSRLGTNADFAAVCGALHDAGIKVVLDGVFNHVGRGFWAFQDVLEKREASPYKDWFFLDFNGNSNYNDGLWYDGWEGHFELVRLNLANPAVTAHLLECVGGWIDEFGIDGIRLDVAYCLPHDFMRALRAFVDGKKQDFFLVGEVLHGDYKALIQPDMLHSATNYECFKGIFSSLNSLNMYEIAYSLNRQFGPEDWTLYKGLHLLNFVDNHDVSRIASNLTDKNQLPAAYGLLFGMPGIPCLYYGSEWGAEGDKSEGDAALRKPYDAPVENDLFHLVAKMAAVHRQSDALVDGGYRQVYLTNRQFIFERKTEGQRVLVAINAEDAPHTAHFDAGAGMATDWLSGETVDFGGGYDMAPYAVQFLEMER